MQITGIILAGGKSTRMGTDKAMLKINDETLIKRASNLCRPVCSQVLISSNSPAHEIDGLARIADEFAGCGPIGGIYSCLKQSDTEWNFVVAVDTPFVNTDFIHFLLSRAENVDAIVPVHAGNIEPLIALYNRKCLPEIESQLKNQQFKIHKLLKELNTLYVDVSDWALNDTMLFTNMNHPGDLLI